MNLNLSKIRQTESSLLAACAFVSLGSNLGDRAANLLLAVRGMLDAGLAVKTLSSIYETAHVPVEGVDNEANQPPFLNMIAELRGDLPAPESLLARLLRIEYALGRRRDDAREQMRRARTIDLDLLFYRSADGEDYFSSSELLTLPHPRLHLRRFVLAPLAEIAPDFAHPKLNQTMRELLFNLTDEAAVKRYEVQ